MATEYGKRLRTVRLEANLTQNELSAITGIPQSTISTAEREGNGSAETPVYAKACGVNALWLANGEGEKHPSSRITTSGTPAKHETNEVVSIYKTTLSNSASSEIILGEMAHMTVPLLSWVRAGEFCDSPSQFTKDDATALKSSK